MSLKAWRRSLRYRIKETLGLPIKPVKLRFAITKRCNARCTHCSAWKLQHQDPSIRKRELALDELDLLFAKSGDFLRNVKSISITGGEPFVRSDVEEIIKLFTKHLSHVTIRINTNGFLTSKIVETVSNCAPVVKRMVVNISLDGSEQTHDKIRGVEKAFSRAMNTLNELKNLTFKKLTLGVNFTLNDLNVGELQEVFQICRQNGYKFNLIVPHYGHLYQNFDDPVPLHKEAKIEALEKLRTLEREDPRPEYAIIKEELLSQTRPFRCWAGMVLVLIDYDGRVYPNSGCPSEWWLGDLRRENYDLKRLITTPRARSILKKVKNCRACLLWCEAAPSLRHPEALYYEKLGGSL